MARISGVDIPREKRIDISLRYIFGIGPKSASLICEKTGIEPATKARDLTDAELDRIRESVTRFTVEGDLRREVSMSIKRLMDLGCYRGHRHRKGLPVRGQRTRTNARTRKGPRKAAIKLNIQAGKAA